MMQDFKKGLLPLSLDFSFLSLVSLDIWQEKSH